MGTKCPSLAMIPTLSMILNEIIVSPMWSPRKIAMYQDTEIFHILFTLESRYLNSLSKILRFALILALS